MQERNARDSVRQTRVWARVLVQAAMLCISAVSAHAAWGQQGPYDGERGAPARMRQFSPRAVGGAWASPVAGRLDALTTHARSLAELRARRRAGEPGYSRVVALKPARLFDNPGSERRR